ncbi:cephalosporin hydroxylase family protein [Aurantimonas sp. MSK8Z-1]|uniref:cephalosporin hydroxylase family protein n=1 Tax=Mangrovibrevibacter kandeliae TaxID=2968473 RepID=UPI0021196E6B|nr:CmcI family methyltransferase [Aurantimonas sp. MSK8Z-1]MCW4116992.1 cephalosporin hydroxylase family protein [Aurantimonas sp. MSK8Z-1]
MRLTIDSDQKTLDADGTVLDLYGPEAFKLIADLWLKASWNQKYSYTFSWLGRPVIQHPDDMIRLQEAIYSLKPDVIIETGVAHGGSLIYSASLLKAMGHTGKVVGVDIEIRPHNRSAIEAHELSDMIVLIEGDSAATDTVAKAAEHIRPGDTVLVILDSDHSYAHVMRELDAYKHLVTPGSYIVATDGIMELVHDTPRGKPGWTTDNPSRAALDWVERNPEFTLQQPVWPFNESELSDNVTAWPNAWLKRSA